MTTPTFDFPCSYVIKVFGSASDEFETAVLTIIHKHCPALSEGALQLRPSKNGNYLALSITVNAESREHLDNMYRELSAHPQILMVL